MDKNSCQRIANIIENLHREILRSSRMDEDEERWHFENTAKEILNLIEKEKNHG